MIAISVGLTGEGIASVGKLLLKHQFPVHDVVNCGDLTYRMTYVYVKIIPRGFSFEQAMQDLKPPIAIKVDLLV